MISEFGDEYVSLCRQKTANNFLCFTHDMLFVFFRSKYDAWRFLVIVYVSFITSEGSSKNVDDYGLWKIGCNFATPPDGLR